MNRVEHYQDRATECRQLAEIVGSSETQSDYLRLAEHYIALAESEGAKHVRREAPRSEARDVLGLTAAGNAH